MRVVRQIMADVWGRPLQIEGAAIGALQEVVESMLVELFESSSPIHFLLTFLLIYDHLQ